MTYTYAVLDVPEIVYATVRALLVSAGYEHAFHRGRDGEVLDMHGIALRLGETSKRSVPWTPEQVDALNRWQSCGWVHPFTCGSCGGLAQLHATVRGWICPYCDYTQEWAHEVMFGPLPPSPLTAQDTVTTLPRDP